MVLQVLYDMVLQVLYGMVLQVLYGMVLQVLYDMVLQVLYDMVLQVLLCGMTLQVLHTWHGATGSTYMAWCYRFYCVA